MHAHTLPSSTRTVLLAAVLAAAIAGGLFGLYGYVRQYTLYRGFGPPTPTVAPGLRGRIVPLTIRSRALGGTRERILVYLPAGYATHPDVRYPVLYLLHGTPGSPKTAYVNSLHVGPRMDLLIHHGMRPFIVAIPPGSPGTYQHATEWANSPTPGQDWFTYLTRDVVRAVDTRFRTLPSASDRGVAGYSSGADAAVNAGLLVPHEFGIVEGWSGDYHQTPSTVDRNAWLEHRFSALDTASARAPRAAGEGGRFYLYAGQDDRVLPATIQVAHALRKGGVPVRLDLTGGGHSWKLWADRFDGALRWFATQTERNVLS
ncbi:MAG TPA: alpha/beta hydrolase-fold protein [Gaiellales bacterium]|jgi:enterochelin esterase-like enzyme